jgi:hypothetical protein
MFQASLGIATIFENSIRPNCDKDLAAVGATSAQVAKAARNVNFLNGWTDGSQINYAVAVYGNTPLLNAALNGQYGGVNLDVFFAANKGTVAVSQLSGNNVYLNSGFVNAMNPMDQAAMLLHELLHNSTGKVDDDLQRALGLATGGASHNISDLLEKDCF